MKTRIVRQKQFSSAHFYHQPLWSDEENRRVFGACFNPHGHGHNYVLELTIEGPVDPMSGMILNLVDIDNAMEEVLKPLDHHHLNFEIEEFKTLIPTTENIAAYCYKHLQPRIEKSPGLRVQRVRLYERSDLWAEVEP